MWHMRFRLNVVADRSLFGNQLQRGGSSNQLSGKTGLATIPVFVNFESSSRL